MKLVDLLNKMPNMELVKVKVYVFGGTSERNFKLSLDER